MPWPGSRRGAPPRSSSTTALPAGSAAAQCGCASRAVAARGTSSAPHSGAQPAALAAYPPRPDRVQEFPGRQGWEQASPSNQESGQACLPRLDWGQEYPARRYSGQCREALVGLQAAVAEGCPSGQALQLRQWPVVLHWSARHASIKGRQAVAPQLVHQDLQSVWGQSGSGRLRFTIEEGGSGSRLRRAREVSSFGRCSEQAVQRATIGWGPR